MNCTIKLFLYNALSTCIMCLYVCACVCRLENHRLKEELRTKRAHLEQLRVLHAQLRCAVLPQWHGLFLYMCL